MKRNITAFIFFFIIVGALITLSEENTNSVSAPMRDVFAVPQKGWSRLKERFRLSFRDKEKLLEENTQLRLEIERLRNQIQQYKPLQEENQSLRDLLQLKSTSQYQLLAAQILARDVNGWWQTARIDKGAADGAQKDLPVITPEGLVGQIVNVSRNTADIQFITHSKVKIAARMARSDVFGIVRGQGVSLLGRAKCRMDFITKGADINKADEAVTSGLGGVYPAGIAIGHVENIGTDPSGLFQYAEIAPAADFGALEVVFIVLPEKQPVPVKAKEKQKAP